ncbi:hypothetical protein SETIT_2G192300v2 [Setaria italica]|uniref:Uncharacterized protein n=1 Tax=Setaria italica TaxID=4555 RepID=A0A368Q0F9_SETIT|nr:hypothetical protein SETIT_2G192300v2 [Setaria italica]
MRMISSRINGRVMDACINGYSCLRSVQLWKERNARVFRDDDSTTQQVLMKIRQDADLWISAGAKELGRLRGE